MGRLRRVRPVLAVALWLGLAGAASQAAAPQAQVPQAGTGGSASAQLARAEARYRASLALDPTVGSYHASLAVVLMRQGRLEEARQSAAAAVRLDPMSPRSRGVFGEVLVAQERWADAESQLEEAIRYGGRDVLRLEALAQAYARQGKWSLAAGAYRDALQLEPESLAAQQGYRDAVARSDGPPPPLDLEIAWGDAPTRGAGFISVLRVLGGIALVIAGVGVLYPLIGFLYLALILAPVQLVRRRSAWSGGSPG